MIWATIWKFVLILFAGMFSIFFGVVIWGGGKELYKLIHNKYKNNEGN